MSVSLFRRVSKASSATLSSVAIPTYRNYASKVVIIGAGQMGLGISYISALNAKYNTTVVDIDTVRLEKGEKFISSLLSKALAKNKIAQEQVDETKGLLTFSTDLKKSVAEADIIIEAASEVPSLKFSLFEQLAQNADSKAILASNTSSISITKIAAAAKNAESRVIGVHFFNPVPVMAGVEIIKGLQTSDETIERAKKIVGDMKKTVCDTVDSPGFIANRLLMPYINEAIILLDQGTPRESIDAIMVKGCNMPMGPLALADFIGLDTCLAIMDVIYSQTGDCKYRAALGLRRYVDAGWLGKKNGKGFYEY